MTEPILPDEPFLGPFKTQSNNSLCGACQRYWTDAELLVINDLFARVEAGDRLPSGECPHCHGLCHPAGFRRASPSPPWIPRRRRP